jgi:frataxin-like iron-binding protein CyaY
MNAHTADFSNTVVAIAQQYKLHVIFAINLANTALFVVNKAEPTKQLHQSSKLTLFSQQNS